MLVPLVSLLIPIVAIVMGVGIGMLTIYLNYRKRKEMFALYHQERMAAIDKGIELPPLPDAFFTDDGKPYRQRSPRRHLLTGMILLFIGIILFTAFYIDEQLHTALLTLIPAGIGLAYLIFYFAVGRKEAEAFEAAQKAKASETTPLRQP
jgi:peptidoglycan/LPS O-acetylase OafA/YrhL